jgi:hypothetical protein
VMPSGYTPFFMTRHHSEKKKKTKKWIFRRFPTEMRLSSLTGFTKPQKKQTKNKEIRLSKKCDMTEKKEKFILCVLCQ